MSRQRLRPTLGESSRMACPRCDGQGTIRSVEALALIVMRVIEEEAIKDNTGEVRAELPVEVATYLMNEKRQSLVSMEERHNIRIIIIPNAQLTTPHYNVERIRLDNLQARASEPASYKLSSKLEHKTSESSALLAKSSPVAEPAVKTFIPPVQAPLHKAEEAPGLMKRLWSSLFGVPEQDESAPHTTISPSNHRRPVHRGNNRRDKQNNQVRRSQNRRSGNGNQLPPTNIQPPRRTEPQQGKTFRGPVRRNAKRRPRPHGHQHQQHNLAPIVVEQTEAHTAHHHHHHDAERHDANHHHGTEHNN